MDENGHKVRPSSRGGEMKPIPQKRSGLPIGREQIDGGCFWRLSHLSFPDCVFKCRHWSVLSPGDPTEDAERYEVGPLCLYHPPQNTD